MIGGLDAGYRMRGEFVDQVGRSNFRKRRHGTPRLG
jgi:hypothetical protein